MNLHTDRERTCCFTGYRPEKLPWVMDENDSRCVALKERLDRELERICAAGIRNFICGMARGADMYFCEAVLVLRERRPDITIEAAIPCEEQALKWFEDERSRYFRLVALCDCETYVSRRFTRDCMAKRNRYMVDKSAVLLAVYDGKFGGTMQTVEYAARRGLEIIRLAP